MKRYGDNLPSNRPEEAENQNGKTVEYMNGNCAVRQDMVAFLMSTDVPNKSKTWNIFSFFRFGQKKIKENSD